MYSKILATILILISVTSCKNGVFSEGVSSIIPTSDIIYHQLEESTLFYNTKLREFHRIQHRSPISIPDVVLLIKVTANSGIEIVGADGKSYIYTILAGVDSKESTSIIGWSKFRGPGIEKVLLTKNGGDDQKTNSSDLGISVSEVSDDDINALVCKCRSKTNPNTGQSVVFDDDCDAGGVGSNECDRETGGQVVDVGAVTSCRVRCHPGYYACCIDNPDP